MNGLLQKSWEVHCAKCEHPVLGLALNQSVPEASKELRADGWGTRRGLWYCPDCILTISALKGGA